MSAPTTRGIHLAYSQPGCHPACVRITHQFCERRILTLKICERAGISRLLAGWPAPITDSRETHAFPKIGHDMVAQRFFMVARAFSLVAQRIFMDAESFCLDEKKFCMVEKPARMVAENSCMVAPRIFMVAETFRMVAERFFLVAESIYMVAKPFCRVARRRARGCRPHTLR